MNKKVQDGQILLQIPEKLFPQFEKEYKKFLETEQKEQRLMDTLTLYYLDKFEQWCESNDYSKIVLGCERIKANTNVEYKDLKSLINDNLSAWSQFLKHCKTSQFKSALHLKGFKILLKHYDILQEKLTKEMAAGVCKISL